MQITPGVILKDLVTGWDEVMKQTAIMVKVCPKILNIIKQHLNRKSYKATGKKTLNIPTVHLVQ